MSVFTSSGFGAEVAKQSALGRCKRDYETEIKNIRDRKQSAADFLASVYKYVYENGGSGDGKPFTLGELIGLLELEVRTGDKIISSLIEEQEREKA